MISQDVHARYHHDHYVLQVRLFVQSNGEIKVHLSNVCLALLPDEVQVMLDGILDLARTFSILHNASTPDIVGLIEAESESRV